MVGTRIPPRGQAPGPTMARAETGSGTPWASRFRRWRDA